MILRLLTGMGLLSLGQALGQAEPADDLRVLEGDQRQVLWNVLINQSRQLDQQRAKRLDRALESPDALEQHLAKLRENYRGALGRFPEKTPLNAQVTGRLDGGSYRVEKVLFESLPNHHVTGLLYLPEKGSGPWPGVLFACGHSANGKAHTAYQTACALMAQNGFVVLSYDPISQGERTQQPKARRYGTTTHTLLNHGSRLVGRSVVWYSAWDGVRAIDYLLSRSEVDRSRPIGMTGTSGGGTQTTFLMALDDRIGPAAPSCYTMQRTDKFTGKSGPSDGCQHLACEGLHGIDHIDYTLMRFPRPTQILAAIEDFFEIDSTRETVRDARAVFSTLGRAERFGYHEAEAKHGMHVGHRQEATRWMLQWLYGEPFSVIEPADIRLFSDAELQVTQSGQVYREFENEEDIAAINLRLAKRLEANRKQFWKGDKAMALAKMRELIGLPETRPKAIVRRKGRFQNDWAQVDKLVFQQPDGMPVPALLFRPPNHGNRRLDAVIIADGRGMKRVAESTLVREFLNEKTAVFTVDLRGFGETRDAGSNAKYQSHSHRTANVGTHIGRPLLGQRVGDLMSVVDFLEDAGSDRVGDIRLVGIHAAAPAALHAAALDDRVQRTILQQSPVNSWVDDVVAKPLRSDMVDHVVPGALRWYDLSDLEFTLKDRLWK